MKGNLNHWLCNSNIMVREAIGFNLNLKHPSNKKELCQLLNYECDLYCVTLRNLIITIAILKRMIEVYFFLHTVTFYHEHQE